MPKENKALKIVRVRLGDAAKRLTDAESVVAVIKAEIDMLSDMDRMISAAYQSKPKRAVKVKPNVVETPKPV